MLILKYILSQMKHYLKYLCIAQQTFNSKACTGTNTNHWHFSDLLQIYLHMKDSM